MDKIELAPDIFLNLETFIAEGLLPLFTSLIWVIIIFVILLKSYQGIKREIKGSKYIFWGLIGSFVFSLASSLFVFLIEQTIFDSPIVFYFIEFISILILLIPVWGFKILMDNLKKH